MGSIGLRLRAAREAKGLSARQLDALAELTPGHTSAVESGRRADPSASTLERLANALGVTLDWLIRGGAPSSRRVRKAS